MNKSHPKVSVVIPSYNRYDFLINSINSVENQTYKNIEIIVINDGSDQEEYYTKNFQKNIKVVNLEKNQKSLHGFGPGAIRNFGTNEASGEYLAFLDDDDIWLPNKLSTQINNMIESNFKFSCTEAYIGNGVYDKSKIYKLYNSEHYLKKIKKKYRKTKYFKFNSYPKIFTYDFINIHNCIITSSVVVEKTLFNNVGKFRNLPSNADYDCWQSLLKFEDCLYINEPLVYYDLLHANGREYSKIDEIK